MRGSLNAEQTSKTTTGRNSDKNDGKSSRRTRQSPRGGFSMVSRLHKVVMTAGLLMMFLQGSMAATTDIYALEKMRVADLKQILKSRGLSCDGCTEKKAYVDMVVESSHMDRAYSSHRMRSTNPNDWKLPRDDFRIDLWATLAPAVASVARPLFRLALDYPLLAVACMLALALAGLKLAHKHGKHTDIPFKQYLRFQARLQYKHALRAGKWVYIQLLSVRMVSTWLWDWVRQRSASQLLHTGGVLSLWALFSYLGFGAVFVLVMGLVTVFMNLGERKAGQASAYTIFNNFQPLEGELRMEQIEAEMRHMPMPRQNLHLEPLHAQDADSEKVVKAGRNDRVEVESKDGVRKVIKFKNLQEHLDRGYLQVDAACYDGIVYRNLAD
mmetsp:Transcript_17507/g.42474  ORF Transcript_17507/g.42474 Transcript_17507/m.42474 type:complete len:383 (+) Transcript_17507:290-1438(+)